MHTLKLSSLIATAGLVAACGGGTTTTVDTPVVPESPSPEPYYTPASRTVMPPPGGEVEIETETPSGEDYEIELESDVDVDD